MADNSRVGRAVGADAKALLDNHGSSRRLAGHQPLPAVAALPHAPDATRSLPGVEDLEVPAATNSAFQSALLCRERFRGGPGRRLVG